jgi:hypothetical protein
MNLDIKWLAPFFLSYGSDQFHIYKLEDDAWLPSKPGVYIFARQFGDKMIPIYVGKAKDLNKRIPQELNTVKLMKGIENAPHGDRVLIVGVLKLKPGQKPEKAIRIIESVLIEHSLAQGFDILNIKGAKTPAHSILFTGNRKGKKFTGGLMKARARGID